jgi:hypothetical protein
LVIEWLAKFDNTLDDSRLLVRLYKSTYDIEGSRNLMEANKLYQADYVFDMNDQREVGWRNQKLRKQFISTDTLVERRFTHLLDEMLRAIDEDS